MSAGSSARLAGRAAIVTGSSRGLGRAIATSFAQEGAAVAVVARTESEWSPLHPGTIHEVVREIEAKGGQAVAIPADLSRTDDVERVFYSAREALGPISILVNNAALTTPGRPPTGNGRAGPQRGAAFSEVSAVLNLPPFVDLPLKAFRMHFQIGLFAAFRLMQLVLPEMIESRRGSIINIGSAAAFVPGEGPYQQTAMAAPVGYGANKAALHYLTQAVAVAVQSQGIAVNALLPSEPVLTPGNLVAAAGETQWASAGEFAEAAVRVALADPATTTGCLLWHDDVLHPELGRRGWLRPM
ncbi:SDR family NAD(P)-dependent oxidoreductase [uncultured Mycobacterium sp.]|uniref:SDR family NAD(P)-dependent oxidoreductase n=1 Tax=uncultured Mycobacterium sp. TaxID=171292 RepID=UPI0035CB653C